MIFSAKSRKTFAANGSKSFGRPMAITPSLPWSCCSPVLPAGRCGSAMRTRNAPGFPTPSWPHSASPTRKPRQALLSICPAPRPRAMPAWRAWPKPAPCSPLASRPMPSRSTKTSPPMTTARSDRWRACVRPGAWPKPHRARTWPNCCGRWTRPAMPGARTPRKSWPMPITAPWTPSRRWPNTPPCR